MKASKVFFIAEAGVNHNGDLKRAMRLVQIAKSAGADAVKFQTFEASKLVTKGAPSAGYQKKAKQGSRQLAMLKKLELKRADFLAICRYCRSLKIEFLSTPFDQDSLYFLVNDLGLRKIKISSGDLTNSPLLYAAANLGVEIILSTGMATIAEIESAIGVLALGYRRQAIDYTVIKQNKWKKDPALMRLLQKKLTILHCVTEYPAPLEDINLLAMEDLRMNLRLPVGYSDHTLGTSVSVAAAALGATVIEKHFTENKNLAGPDHAMSLDASELGELISEIREVEQALGSRKKAPSASELKNKVICRKSLVAAEDVSAGETWTSKNLTAKRPGAGMSPLRYWKLIGKSAKRSYKKDSLIRE